MIIVILPFGVSALVFIPKTAGDLAENLPSRDKSKRLYIVNCFLMLSSVIFLVLGITLSAPYGWKKLASWYPSCSAGPYLWSSMGRDYRKVMPWHPPPPSFWNIPNMTILIVLALGIYPWWLISHRFSSRNHLLHGGDIYASRSTNSLCSAIHQLLQWACHHCGCSSPSSRYFCCLYGFFGSASLQAEQSSVPKASEGGTVIVV